MTPELFRAQTALLRFQHALDSLEHELKPLEGEMSIECRFELQMAGRVCRSFFTMANEEILSKAREFEPEPRCQSRGSTGSEIPGQKVRLKNRARTTPRGGM